MRAIRPRDDDLEEIFLRYYRDGAPVSRATTELTLRLRLAGAISAAFGLIAVLVAVGALFPAVGHSIGKLDLPKGVSNLLGGADYATHHRLVPQRDRRDLRAAAWSRRLAITGVGDAPPARRRTGSSRSCSPTRSRRSRLVARQGRRDRRTWC